MTVNRAPRSKDSKRRIWDGSTPSGRAGADADGIVLADAVADHGGERGASAQSDMAMPLLSVPTGADLEHCRTAG